MMAIDDTMQHLIIDVISKPVGHIDIAGKGIFEFFRKIADYRDKMWRRKEYLDNISIMFDAQTLRVELHLRIHRRLVDLVAMSLFKYDPS
jgi:hypothetical protein